MTQSFLRKLIPVFVCVMMLGLGCSSKQLRYPEDHARFERIMEAVEILRTAYITQDLPAMQALLLPTESLEQFDLEVSKDFRAFSTITLEFSIERVTIRQDRITVYILWSGTWKRSLQDVALPARGHGVLELRGNRVILLAAIAGNVPFGMASRQPLS